MERGACRRRPGPGELRENHRLGPELLRRLASIWSGRSILEFHDGRRRGPDSCDVSGQLRSAGGDQSEVRPREFLPRESEHPAKVGFFSALTAASNWPFIALRRAADSCCKLVNSLSYFWRMPWSSASPCC